MKITNFISLFVLAMASLANQAAASPEGPTATISGSQTERRNAFMDDQTAFVSAIDGADAPHAKKHWEQPTPLAVGVHQISASFSFGSYRAKAPLTLNALAGHSYVLKATSNAKWRGGDYYCDFWIIDAADSNQVSETVRAGVNYTKIIFVPLAR